MRPCQSHCAPCLHRLPELASPAPKRCELQIEGRLSAADGLSRCLLDLEQPSRMHSQRAGACRGRRRQARFRLPKPLRRQGLAAVPKACQMASSTQTEDGSLLRVPQEVPAAHMTASLRPSCSHAIRSAGWHLELPVGGQGRDEAFTASGRPPMGG